MKHHPLEHQPHDSGRQRTSDDLQGFEGDDCLVCAVPRMEVRRFVIVVEHGDDHTKESTELGHESESSALGDLSVVGGCPRPIHNDIVTLERGSCPITLVAAAASAYLPVRAFVPDITCGFVFGFGCGTGFGGGFGLALGRGTGLGVTFVVACGFGRGLALGGGLVFPACAFDPWWWPDAGFVALS